MRREGVPFSKVGHYEETDLVNKKSGDKMIEIKPIPLLGGLAALIIAVSVAYYLVIFLPEKERARQEQVTKELELKEAEQSEKRKTLKVYEDCDSEANKEANNLLKSKIEISQKAGASVPTGWKEASEKGLHLKDDYNSYYDSCLRRHGIKY